jgi:hypothetical protein
LEWMLGHCDGMNCASLLKRMELSWEECQRIAPDITAIMGKPENPVTENVRDVVKAALRTGGSLFKAVTDKSEGKRAILRDYAAQEGLLGEFPTGMVEIGWSGRTRSSLERALAGHNLTNLHWFYFGIHHLAKLADSNRVHYFLYGPELRLPEIPFLPVVIESFCLALHGSVTGYRREGSNITPIFREGIEKQLEDWGRGQVFEAIQEYLRYFPINQGQFQDMGDLSGVTRDLLTDFCTNPSAEDAKFWGTIPFEHDQAAKASFPLAPDARLTHANLKNALIYGSVQRACMGESMGAWGAGSWAARGNPLYLLTLAAWAGYLRIHWRKLPQRTFSKIRRTLSHLRHS